MDSSLSELQAWTGRCETWRDQIGATPVKAWRDIWGCGQGIGVVEHVVSVDALVDRLEREYRDAREAL